MAVTGRLILATAQDFSRIAKSACMCVATCFAAKIRTTSTLFRDLRLARRSCTLRVDVAKFAQERDGSVEDVGRQVRYDAARELAQNYVLNGDFSSEGKDFDGARLPRGVHDERDARVRRKRPWRRF